ncbi:50S ribosomal protein L25 [Rickettsiales endosymbiont of Paramecium tredecaurelia]|uniref:50S ribosomal protein L25/general stress protein Ctc n=1 Tax=Candidatus Sarmatiella mevalonica TaxID=2770581 RepID=UPI00192390FD|nr:50S ribosomal protein L25/general stress protein Ctc [Candidatus Sarmatiella mevalonica]MBL3285150.1 50S ribosomal protein L25 [Candidatus Sarmatiella mevalonica]
MYPANNSSPLEFVAQERSNLGTGASRDYRRRGLLPSVAYGAGKSPMHFLLDLKEFSLVCKRQTFPASMTVVKLNGKEYKLLPQSVQFHPVTDFVEHVDFVFVEEDKPQVVNIPLIFTNSKLSPGVKRGGFFNIVRRSLKVLANVANMPSAIEVDVSGLGPKETIKAKQVELPSGIVCCLDKAEQVLVSIISKRGGQDDKSAENTSA